ncbi:MAG: transglycosylase [Ktedonobacteraceae bacterium]|nr:transglycosylase [Ktedonobacteraceae bacterium]
MAITFTMLVVWLMIAALVGLVGELIARRRVADGILGAIILGFIAIVLVVGVLHISISGEPTIAGVPLITSILAAALLTIIWSAFAYQRVYRPYHERYYYRRGNYARRPRRRWLW